VTSATGVFAWNVPDDASTNCLVKVVDYNDGTVVDQSDATFEIVGAISYAELLEPDSLDVYQAGFTHQIEWSQFGISPTVDLEYSYDNGQTWIFVVNTSSSNGIPGAYNWSAYGSYVWTIPNTPSDSCRFRIRDGVSGPVLDVSGPFSITPAIEVTNPDGGEVFEGCVPQTITWQAVSTSTYDISLSVDSGQTWTSLITDHPGTSWTWSDVPNMNYPNALIRVVDSNDSLRVATSEAVFSIVPVNEPMTITSPTSGSDSYLCEGTTISWTADQCSSGQYDIDYSADGGQTWVSLSVGHTSTSYTWVLPNTLPLGSDYRIRVTDAVDASVTTTSSPFNVLSRLTLASLNSGEVLISNNTYTIYYNAISPVTSVNLSYSIDGGVNWITIQNSYNGGGSYNWVVPNTASETALFRVVRSGSACYQDISDTFFTILNEVNVVVPNGGEQVQAEVGLPFGTGQYTMDNVPLVTDGGYLYDSGGPNSNYGTGQSYTKTIYPETPGNKIRLTCYYKNFGNDAGDVISIWDGPTASGNPTWTYTGNNAFDRVSTHATGALTVRFVSNGTTAPGFEAYIRSQGQPTYEIDWDITGTTGVFDLYYSTNNGLSWKGIANKVTSATGVFAWNVPDDASTNCLVKVVDYNDGTVVDQSDATFEILAGESYITIESPNGGEILYGYSDHEITWISEFLSSAYVVIEYTSDYGSTWQLIDGYALNNGAYTWTIPNVDSEQCLVRVSEYGNSSEFDLSNGLFTIRPGITVTTPNGSLGQAWRGCTESTIEWEWSGIGANTFDIELSEDGGLTWDVVANNYPCSTVNCTYDWTIPNSSSSECLVRITDNDFQIVTDQSNDFFEITPAITLTFPSTGGTLSADSIYTITWLDSASSNFYDIDYSIDNGNSWINIETNYYTVTRDYDWVVPQTYFSNCLVRVTDNVNNCKTDISDSPFAIIDGASIEIINPNGGDALTGCTTIDINWIDAIGSGIYNVLYSVDGGVNWIDIVNNYSTQTGSYTWDVPNVYSEQCLVRIEDVFNVNNYYDVSDAFFTIDSVFTAEITVVGNTEGCQGDTIQLTSNYLTGNTWFPSGQTSQSINVTSSGTYYLQVDDAGCISESEPIDITISPLPPTPVVTADGPTLFCDGGSVTLTSSSSSGNYWLPTGSVQQSINVTESGSYFVINTQNGCSSSSQSLEVVVNEIPQSPVIYSNSPVPYFGSITLSSDYQPQTQYNWTGPSGFSSNLLNNQIDSATTINSGGYQLRVLRNGCWSDYSSTSVTVLPPTPTVNVSGDINNQIGLPVRGVTLTATSGMNSDSTLTDTTGFYALDLEQNSVYTLTPKKNNDSIITNGISTLDLILIQSHILSLNLLTNPYDIIAADVNLNSSITTFDIVLIRSIILNINNAFPGNRNWAFVNSDYAFPVPENPFGYLDHRQISSSTDLQSQDFIGVKLGDVNGSWDPSIARIAGGDDIVVTSESMDVGIGDTITQLVRVDAFDDKLGFQFTLEWNSVNLEYLGVSANPMQIVLSEHMSEDGYLTGSWFSSDLNPVTMQTGDSLFEIRYLVKQPFETEHVEFTSSKTKAESYGGDLSTGGFIGNLGAIYNTVVTNMKDEIETSFSISPNPSSGPVDITFNSPIRSGRIIVYDEMGRRLKNTRLNGSDPKVSFDLSEFGKRTSGTYHIVLITDSGTWSESITLIR
jgi:hypothetical protein